jgi:hypothetical protein
MKPERKSFSSFRNGSQHQWSIGQPCALKTWDDFLDSVESAQIALEQATSLFIGHRSMPPLSVHGEDNIVVCQCNISRMCLSRITDQNFSEQNSVVPFGCRPAWKPERPGGYAGHATYSTITAMSDIRCLVDFFVRTCTSTLYCTSTSAVHHDPPTTESKKASNLQYLTTHCRNVCF